MLTDLAWDRPRRPVLWHLPERVREVTRGMDRVSRTANHLPSVESREQRVGVH